MAFLQMVKISAAIEAHRRARLPYLVYLRHPTTGGVFASWGSLGHITAAEPGALVGFLGPRVYEALYGGAFPTGVQLSENLYEHGLVDAVVDGTDAEAATALDTDGLFGLIAAARLVLSTDTGTGHVASAFGTPSVTLFGPVSPARWGPPARRRHQPHGCRRAARRLPVGWRRQLDGGRVDGGGVGESGQDLHDRLRRSRA